MNAYQKAVQRIRDNRREALDRAHLVWQNALHDNDELYACFCAYQEQAILAAQKKKNSLEAARNSLKEKIAASGISEEALEPPYECKECKDSGTIGGKYCKCVIKRVISSDKENLALTPVDFDGAQKTAPTAAIKKAYKLAAEYINDNNAKPFFILLGAPGTGKTVLASAIVNAAMSKGLSAVAVTAFDFVRRALDYHTQFSIPDYVDRFTPMLDCDILVVDDLGTESMLKNVTKEYLYTVVNERWQVGKRTVITTNKTPAELNARYGESIFSRMCDKSRSTVLSVDAKNSRLS